MLADLVERGEPRVLNQYRRAVTWDGNPSARRLMAEIFEPCDAPWRGLGTIPSSGLGWRSGWEQYDAARRFSMPAVEVKEHPGCRCGEVLRGKLIPPDCGLFRKVCNPQSPHGPCMVSSEGTCGAYSGITRPPRSEGRRHQQGKDPPELSDLAGRNPISSFPHRRESIKSVPILWMIAFAGMTG